MEGGLDSLHCSAPVIPHTDPSAVLTPSALHQALQ